MRIEAKANSDFVPKNEALLKVVITGPLCLEHSSDRRTFPKLIVDAAPIEQQFSRNT